ncbi:hypothetical protein CK203_085166 [Vitis vinifera]|uniref:Uncharacterized protein n=2 Tax=Vitis TaxID=3603 RepID=A0A438E0Q7_VITVI|nr:hypothetical protein CK203_085166 [Vitis vinifera]
MSSSSDLLGDLFLVSVYGLDGSVCAKILRKPQFAVYCLNLMVSVVDLKKLGLLSDHCLDPLVEGVGEGKPQKGSEAAGSEEQAMEVYGKCMVAGPTNVIFLSSILGRDGPIPGHKCDWKCDNEHVCGNMYRCKLTGITHICDKNCNQRILYDNHSSLCRVSGQVFPFTPAEEQAVRGVRRKLDAENSPTDSCAFKRRRDAQFHPSPFERSFRAVGPICSQIGDGMDMS